MFKKNDKVIIKANDNNLIGGMFNHLSIEGIKYYFNNKRVGFISACWENEIIGDIVEIGKDNIYLIRSGNDRYAFTNNYNEMKLLEG